MPRSEQQLKFERKSKKLAEVPGNRTSYDNPSKSAIPETSDAKSDVYDALAYPLYDAEPWEYLAEAEPKSTAKWREAAGAWPIRRFTREQENTGPLRLSR